MKNKLQILLWGMVSASLLIGCGASANSAAEVNSKSEAIQTEEESSESEIPSEEPVSRDIFAMDTYMTITAYGENGEAALDAGETRINELDELLSTGSESSEVTLLNQKGEGVLSEDTKHLMEASLTLYEETEGAFNIAIYPLMSLWGFPTQEYKVPTDEEIASILPVTDLTYLNYEHVTGEVIFEIDGMAIDFGGIAKGYTSNSLMEIFKENGVEHALVNLGGNVQTLGTKPDGSFWNVAIRTPDDTGDILCVVQVADEAVITSGGYERYFEEDGVTYHHILDPKTGKPADSGLTSVTIVSQNGTIADGFSTAMFVAGKEKAIELWRSSSEDFEMVLVEDDGSISATEGLKDRILSDFEIEIVS